MLTVDETYPVIDIVQKSWGKAVVTIQGDNNSLNYTRMSSSRVVDVKPTTKLFKLYNEHLKIYQNEKSINSFNDYFNK